MLRAGVGLFLFLAVFSRLNGSDDVFRIGAGVTLPRVLQKVDPEYSLIARAAHIEGTVVLSLVVDQNGRATAITVRTPLGFGLDERAVAAIEKWRFAPGMKDGTPVKVRAKLEVNFRFPDLWFDVRTEPQQIPFNDALRNLGKSDNATKVMQDLSRQQFPPAMYAVGLLEATGEIVARNPVDGLALLRKAAARNYGPALYQLAVRQIEGQDMPKVPEEGLETMRQASQKGSSTQAQFYLANRYAAGSGMPRDPGRARMYFSLCAANGSPECQYALGRILFDAPSRPERDYLQAVAWFELAAEQGVRQAKEVAFAEAAKLTQDQIKSMTTLKGQLVHQ